MSSQTIKTRDRISGHPYKHAAAIASARRTEDPDDETEEDRKLSSPSLFGVAGVIGGAEFDPYQKYRHNLYPFKEQLAHEVNKLVLEKLDNLKRRAAATTSRHQHDCEDDDESGSSYDDGSETDTLVDDDDDECMLSSSSTLVDDDDDDEITD